MSFVPLYKNADRDANLVERKARIKPDYSILSTEAKPTLASADAGRIIEETDTGDRFRWTGTQWIQTHTSGSADVSDGGISLTVDTDDGSLSTYHKPDYSQLSADAKPTPSAGNEGVTLEETDTGSRFRWTGLKWVSTHLKGAADIHDACVHDVPVNELFHRHTGTATTLAVASLVGATSITVVAGAAFANGDVFQIEETVGGVTTVEVTFPTIIAGGGTNTFTLDRPLDNAFAIGADVELVVTNMAVVGSLATPVSFKMIPDVDQDWHVVRFLLGMVHSTAADDSKFGSIVGGLTNGCILRGYNGAAGQFRTFTNWKTNGDIKMDMYNVDYTDKAGAGNFGTNGRGSIKDATGASPKLIAADGGYLELLVQDDLTGLITMYLKGQGHIEGL